MGGKGSNLWYIITADQPIYAAKIASSETAETLHHSIQNQVDTPGDILQRAVCPRQFNSLRPSDAYMRQ